MDFLKISETKLKITLSSAECDKYNIDRESSEFSGNEIKTVIHDILAVAGERCGFSVDGERILVQLYPLPDGSCELFITKISNLPRRERRVVDETDSLRKLEDRRSVYRFPDTETLLSAVRAIYREGVECDLYMADTGDCYIRLREELSDKISEFEILTEYGSRMDSVPLFVMGEYGSMLAEGDALDYVMRKYG